MKKVYMKYSFFKYRGKYFLVNEMIYNWVHTLFFLNNQ